MATGITSPLVSSPKSATTSYPYQSRMGLMATREFTVFFDDFLTIMGTNLPAGWKAAIIDTGATLVHSTTAGSLGATGGALIASDGTSEGVAIYLPIGVQLTVGKRFFMETRVQTSVAAETDVKFGLSVANATTNPEDLWLTASTDFIAYGTTAGSATMQLFCDAGNSGTTIQAATKTLSDTTWATLAIYYDGAKIKTYKDGKYDTVWAGTAATIPTGVALAPFIGARTGATAGNVTTFDYVRYVIER